MRSPRWLSWTGRKLRGPAYIYWNVLIAAMGHGVGPFLDRKKPARRRLWRVLLVLILLLHLPALLALAWLVSWPLRYLPYLAVMVFVYGLRS